MPHAAGSRLGIGFVYEPELVSADAKQFAKIADVVVVSVGFNAATEGEGHNRTFTLPWGQDALVDAMLAANPHTIVTLTGGGGMDIRRWIDKVPALLHTWYPGQEGGTAVADVLFGKNDPEGKLPVSFDRSWEESPLSPITTACPAETQRCTPLEKTASRSITQSPTSSMAMFDGGLPLLDDDRQASAVPIRLWPELHHIQLWQPEGAGDGCFRI